MPSVRVRQNGMTETPARSPTAADGVQPAADSPPLAPDGAPLCYVVDEESSIRHFLSLVLHGSGVDTVEFPDGAAMRKAIEARAPALVFHNISLESADAIESVVALGKLRYRGAVQLMSARGAAVLEHVKAIGSQHKLQMMPVLKKPFETDTIVRIIQELKLGMPPAVAARLELDDAINNKWIEFWYQPKIALRKKQLAGAEAYARVRHPQHGLVLPGAFTASASDASTARLAELALESALKTSAHFSKLGVNLRLSLNIPVPALVKIPVGDIVKKHHPADEKWPGLIIDLPEDQIVSDLALAVELSKKLEPHNVRLAIDNFGRAYSSLAKVEELPLGQRTAMQDGDRSRAQFRAIRCSGWHRKGGRCIGAGEHGMRLWPGLGLVCPGVATPERKIIRVGDGAPFHRCRLKHLVGNVMALAIGYRLFAGSEVQP